MTASPRTFRSLLLAPLSTVLLAAGISSSALGGEHDPRIVDDAAHAVLSARTPILSSRLATFDFEAPGGGPDPQGWTSADATETPDYWGVDDFAGLGAPYAPLEGSRSMWCGLRPGSSPDEPLPYATLPGYGNNWNTALVSGPIPVVSPARIQFDMRVSTEIGFDRLYVEARDTTSTTWTTITIEEGERTFDDSFVEFPAELEGTYAQVRFRFQSDNEASDQDGDFDSTGAVILDDLQIFTAGVLYHAEDFEGEALGATASDDGFWTMTPLPAAFGDFTGLVGPTGVLQEDPAGPNSSHFWTFFQGSTDTYRCGVVPTQPAVPRPLNPADPTREGSFSNDIRGPWLPLDVDENGQPVVDDISLVRMTVRVYRDMRAQEGVFYRPRVRFRGPGVSGQWRETGYIYFGSTREWTDLDFRFSIPAGAVEVQPAVNVADLAWFLGDAVDDEACHSHGPLIDDVRIDVSNEDLVVTTGLDTGPGSLRAAIAAANASPDPSEITFDLPGDSTVIHLASPLVVETPVLIDATTDPGFTGDPVVELFADPTNGPATMLDIDSDVTLRGFALTGPESTGLQVRGDRNLIENVWFGRSLDGTDRGLRMGASLLDGAEDNRIGGTGADQGCLFTNIGIDGVRIVGASSQRNAVRGSPFISVSTQVIGGLAIDLGNDGEDVNDPLDTDVGPNGRQNEPEISFVNGSGGAIEGFMRSSADTDFELDLFVSSECGGFADPSLAQRYVGSTSVRTNAAGEGWFRMVLGSDLLPEEFVTATATSATGDTSELADCFDVPISVVVTNTNDSGAGSLRAAIDAINTSFNNSRLISFDVAGAGPHVIMPQSPLPVLQRGVVIDGFSQPGASPNTRARGGELDTVWKIALDGSQTTDDGLVFGDRESLVRGLVLHDFDGAALRSTFLGADAEGCAIGVTVAGQPAPNGVGIDLGSSKGRVGGAFAHQRNVVAHNLGDGIVSHWGDVEIRGNVIHSNGGMGIDLGGDGPDGSSPTGSPAPMILDAQIGDAFVTVQYEGADWDTGWVQVFSNLACDPSGSGEGRALIGEWSGEVFQGYSIRDIPLEAPLVGGERLTALFHTEAADWETSEFSTCFEVLNTPIGTDVVVVAGDGLGASLGVTLTFDEITEAGVSLATTDAPLAVPEDYEAGGSEFLDVTTTAEFNGDIDVCVDYDPAGLAGEEGNVVLLHYDTSLDPPEWVDVTATRDATGDVVCGRVSSLSPFVVATANAATGVAPAHHAARALAVAPNPFNPKTTVSFALESAQRVRLEIYDLAGRRVRVLHDGAMGAGLHELQWRGRDDGGRGVASGVYVARLRTDARTEFRKMALVR